MMTTLLLLEVANMTLMVMAGILGIYFMTQKMNK